MEQREEEKTQHVNINFPQHSLSLSLCSFPSLYWRESVSEAFLRHDAKETFQQQ